MVKLAVVGSRSLKRESKRHQVEYAIDLAICALRPSVVISGGAEGVDTIAEEMAICWHIPTEIYRPAVSNWDGIGGFKDRNMKIADRCTHLLCVYDRSSKTKGAVWTARFAEQELGRKVYWWPL